MTENLNLVEMNSNELENINGGIAFLAIVLFAIGPVDVTIGMCLAAGTALGLAGGAVAAANVVK